MTRRTIGGKYELGAEKGRGAMGTVYMATDTKTDRLVAVKLLNPDIARYPKAVQRFKSEAKTLAKLNHPNVATLHDFEAEGAEPFMIMEFITGETLEMVIKKQRMPLEVAVPVFCQILDGIGSAHTKGVIHRDIKPSNVIITKDGVAKVIDFGIARVEGTEGMTRAGAVLGTLAYMSPEQVQGKDADHRSDIYSLGVLLYEMVSGTNPFDRGGDFDTMQAQVNEHPPSLIQSMDAIPEGLDGAIQRALSKDPEKRFQEAGEFRALVAVCVNPKAFVNPPIAAYVATLAKPAPGRIAGSSRAAKATVVESDIYDPVLAAPRRLEEGEPVASKQVSWKVYAAGSFLLLASVPGIWAVKIAKDLQGPIAPPPFMVVPPLPPANWAEVSSPSRSPETLPPISSKQVRKAQSAPPEQAEAEQKQIEFDKQQAELQQKQAELQKKQAEEAERDRRKKDALKLLNEPVGEQKKPVQDQKK